MLEPVRPARLRRELQQRGSQPRRHVPTEVVFVVLADLNLDDDPVVHKSLRPELPQKHGLSHAAQSCDDHQLLGAPTLDSTQQ